MREAQTHGLTPWYMCDVSRAYPDLHVEQEGARVKVGGTQKARQAAFYSFPYGC